MAYLNLGTGIAAGIVIDGELWRGARGTAGEVGHISVDPNGPAVPLRPARLHRGARRRRRDRASDGAARRRLPVRDVFDAADAGDPFARELRAGLARGVAAAVRMLVLTADVDAVVLGGGVTALGDRLMADVAAELAASAEASPVHALAAARASACELLPAGSPAAALGAALVGAARDPEGALAHG